MIEKSTQQAAKVAKIGLIILWLTFIYSLMSCSSTYQTKKIDKNHYNEIDISVKDTLPDYFYINNQIVIIEKERN
jgi:hypothetical protein